MFTPIRSGLPAAAPVEQASRVSVIVAANLIRAPSRVVVATPLSRRAPAISAVAAVCDRRSFTVDRAHRPPFEILNLPLAPLQVGGRVTLPRDRFHIRLLPTPARPAPKRGSQSTSPLR